MTGPRPEKFRLARNICAGYEIRTDSGRVEGGIWLEVERDLHITAPIPIVVFEFGDDLHVTCHPDQQIMSRRRKKQRPEGAR